MLTWPEKCQRQKEIMDLSDLATSPSSRQPKPVVAPSDRKADQQGPETRAPHLTHKARPSGS